jgi:hypothetical protein
MLIHSSSDGMDIFGPSGSRGSHKQQQRTSELDHYHDSTLVVSEIFSGVSPKRRVFSAGREPAPELAEGDLARIRTAVGHPAQWIIRIDVTPAIICLFYTL